MYKNKKGYTTLNPTNGIFGFRHYPRLPTVNLIIFTTTIYYPHNDNVLSYKSFQSFFYNCSYVLFI